MLWNKTPKKDVPAEGAWRIMMKQRYDKTYYYTASLFWQERWIDACTTEGLMHWVFSDWRQAPLHEFETPSEAKQAIINHHRGLSDADRIAKFNSRDVVVDAGVL